MSPPTRKIWSTERFPMGLSCPSVARLMGGTDPTGSGLCLGTVQDMFVGPTRGKTASLGIQSQASVSHVHKHSKFFFGVCS
jgi:hypothetical protein